MFGPGEFNQPRSLALTPQALEVVARKLQARARGSVARKRYKKMKAIFQRAKDAIAARSIEALQDTIHMAEESNIDLHIMGRVEELLAYLNEAKRVSSLLSDALEKNQLESLQAALEQSQKLEMIYNEEKTAELKELVGKAMTARDVILRKAKARKQLNDAVLSEDLGELKAALEEAKAAGIEEDQLFGEAVKLVETLEMELKVMEELAAAVQTGE